MVQRGDYRRYCMTRRAVVAHDNCSFETCQAQNAQSQGCYLRYLICGEKKNRQGILRIPYRRLQFRHQAESPKLGGDACHLAKLV